MKNNFFFIFLTYFILQSFALSDYFQFNTQKIEIQENGSIILASEGVVISEDNNFKIIADNYKYEKDYKKLTINGNGQIFIKDKNININFDNAIFDKKKNIIIVNGDVILTSEKYYFEIKTKKAIYNLNSNELQSNSKTIIKDKKNINYIVENFLFQISKNIIKVKGLQLFDKDKNIIQSPLAFINIKSGKFFGKDVKMYLSKNQISQNNDPRFFGNSIINSDEETNITKGIFTTCKIRDGCPPWELSAEKIQHDKKNKTINYKNALLKVYDIPIMYFPKFFHPDPTVKRKSGFLTPNFNKSKNDGYLNMPYFLAISDNQDITFYPRLYSFNKQLYQTEYRHVGQSSSSTIDTSYFENESDDARTHFFYKFKKKLNIKKFKYSELNFTYENTSSDTYLRAENIQSEIKNDMGMLSNSLDINLYSDDLAIDFNTTIYEDLNKSKNDRYEYILPSINIKKNLQNPTSLGGDFTFSSKNQIRNYDTNIFEKLNINDLSFRSYPIIYKKGLYNNYEFILKNSNTSSQNSKNYKNGDNLSLSSIFQYNSTYPLIKENLDYQKILTPKISVKISPNNNKDLSHDDTQLDINNIYSINRLAQNDMIEGGISFIVGNNYSIINKKNSSEVLNLKFANNFRINKNEDLPKNNQIGEKNSNFFSAIEINPNDYINISYKNSLKNNFSETSSENLITKFKINNLDIIFDYLNENNTLLKNSYLTNTTTYNINSSNNFSFSTRINKSKDLTEYYNMMYQYKNDCLSASIKYKKEFYNDREIEDNESIFLELSIIPFSSINTPNFIN